MREGRLFQIVYHILEKGKSTIPELAEKLEVSERTIYRDIDALSAAGIPVYMERGRNGGVRLMDGFVLHRELLSEEEKKDLLSALQSLTAAGAYNTALLQKLSALFQVSLEEWCEVDFSRWGEQARDNEKFELLKRAVIYHRSVKISYAGAYGEESVRTVWPLKLLYKSRAWYLKAWCTQKKEFRLFKLHRILKWELLEKEFALPDGWEDAARAGESCCAAEQNKSGENNEKNTSKEIKISQKQPVSLRFPRNMAYRVFDEFEESQVTREENGDFLVSVPMSVDAWVVSFLLSFGTQVEILEPAYLRDLVAAEVRTLYQKYK